MKGAKDCVAGARKRIEELVIDLECQVTLECVIEQVHHGAVMGTRGANVQKICKEYDVTIKIPDRRVANQEVNGDNENGGVPESDIIRITGKNDKCEAACKALKDLVPVSIEVSRVTTVKKSRVSAATSM